MEYSTKDPIRIIVRTASNSVAVKILFFYALDVSRLEECIAVEYESCDQAASICRILVDADIDIWEIYTEP